MNRSSPKRAVKNHIIRDPEVPVEIAMHPKNHVQEAVQLIPLPQIIRDILVQDQKAMHQEKVKTESQKVVRKVL